MTAHAGNGTAGGSAGGTANAAGESWLAAVDAWLSDPGHAVWVRLLTTIAVLLGAWAVVRLTSRGLERSVETYVQRRNLDAYQRKGLVGRTKPMLLAVRLAVAVLAIIVLLGVWNYQTAFAGLLAGAGFFGIVIGLAASNTLGNIIAGFLIFYNHPFDVGDWVEVDTVQGTVEDVTLGATTLITFDNEKVTIPNRLVEGQRIKNFSHSRRLRRRITVTVEAGSDLAVALQALVAVAKAHPDVLRDPAPVAVARSFTGWGVDLDLRFWIEPIRAVVVQAESDLIRGVHEALHARGIHLARGVDLTSPRGMGLAGTGQSNALRGPGGRQ